LSERYCQQVLFNTLVGTGKVVLSPQEAERQRRVELRNPLVAAVLAWLVPGLGHLYQGRTAKGILYFVCIMGTFVYGLYLGGNSEVGWGRVVYFSWREGDRRLSFLCQAAVGVAVFPALVQAHRVSEGKEPLLGYFMAPPLLQPEEGDPSDQSPPFSINTLNKRLNRFWEFGTVYTVIAGLLNILAIYDAWGGPVFAEPSEQQQQQEEDQADSS